MPHYEVRGAPSDRVTMGADTSALACSECYRQKSEGYRDCQVNIPADRREERTACFNSVDRFLQECLRYCKDDGVTLPEVALMVGAAWLAVNMLG